MRYHAYTEFQESVCCPDTEAGSPQEAACLAAAEHDPLCKCGHPKSAHEHYRRGTECGICGKAVCPKFRKA